MKPPSRMHPALLLAALLGAGALAACYGYGGYTSVSMGVGVAAPWGGVSVVRPVPVGPYGVGPYRRW